MWLAFAHDTKQNLKLISDGQESLAATLNVLREKLRLHVVEIIGENETSSGAPLACVGAFPTSRQSHAQSVTVDFSRLPTGMEGIVACRLLRDQPCLMHCRVHAGSLAVWLRSAVPDLPDCLIYHCQRALQED